MPPKPGADLDLVKRPHSKTNYTEDQLVELIQCMDDPLYFMRQFMRVQHPTKGAIPFNPYAFQERMVTDFMSNRFTVCMTGRQLGKALALDTPIPTPTGWTTMGEIRVGDQILGDDGQPTRVTFATDVMHDHKCYEVVFDNGEIITADAEHLWTVGSTIFRDKEPRTLTTEQLIPVLDRARRKGHGLHITAADPLALPEVELPIAPYTLGVWLGDGYSDAGRFCGDVADCDEMRELVEADGFALSPIGADKRNNVRYQTIYGLTAKLRAAGLLGRKHIPQIYLRASREQRLALLQGLMDTDGHADPNGGFEFYQKDRVLTDQVAELVSSLGMKPRVKSKIINGETYHRVRFATNRMDVFSLGRKREVARTTKGHSKNHRFFFHEIRPVKSVPVRCIQVDNESHLFLCGKSMIPTHNTTVAVAYLLWKAMFTPDFTILVCANKFEQALEIMQRIRYAYENIPDHIRAGAVEFNKSSITFDNGSRIVSRATTKDSGRGLSISLLYVDEFAFVQPNKATEFWTSIQPTLSTGGSCIITSTPLNDEDVFAQVWKGAINNTDEFGNPLPHGRGRNGFKAILVPWWEHPERDEAWANEERHRIGEAKFRQEHCAEFVSSDETLIDALCLSRLSSSEPEFYTETVRWFSEPLPNHAYLIALDPSMGTGDDYSALQVFRLPEMEQVAEWQHNRSIIRDQVRVLLQTLLYLDATLRANRMQIGDPDIYWTVENNSLGEAVLQVIEDTGEERFPGTMVNERRRKGQPRGRFRKGLNTSHQRKLAACARLKSLIESDRCVLKSGALIREFKSFVKKESSYSAKPGEHDDLVSATLLIARMLDIVLWFGAEGGDLKEHITDDELGDSEPMPVVF